MISMLKKFTASIRTNRTTGSRGERELRRLTLVGLALAPMFLTVNAWSQTTGEGPQVETRAGSPSAFTTNSFAGFRDGAGIGSIENGVGAVAQFNQPVSIAVDSGMGRLFIADQANESLRMFENSTSNFVTVVTYPAGTTPVDVRVDGASHIYVLSQGDSMIRRYDENTNFVGFVNAGGLVAPTAMALDLETNIFIVELGGGLKKVDRGTGLVTPIAVTGGALSAPQGIEVLDSGALVVSDTGNHVIRYMTPSGAITNTVGTISAIGRSLGGPTVASFSSPTKIAKAGDNLLVVADTQNHRVVVITPEGEVSLLYGINPAIWQDFEANLGLDPFVLLPGWEDGQGSVASGRVPSGVAVDGDGNVFTTELYYNTVRAVINTGLKGPGGSISTGGGDGENLPNPPSVSILPASGFFPMGVDVTVTSSSTDVFYRTDGVTPTTNDTRVVINNGVGAIPWFEPQLDLTSLRVAAFAFSGTNSVNTLITGVRPTSNETGVPSDMQAGIGSTIVVPIVVNLASGNELRSLQYRVLVRPDTANLPLLPIAAGDLFGINTTTNDFIEFANASTDDVSPTFVSGSGFDAANSSRILEVSYLSPTNFFIDDFAAVNLVAVTIPNTATEGNRFLITVTNISGTSDGFQNDVIIASATERVITVTNISYVVGDSSPGRWYNAGQFGNGDLRNSDVNNAFLASLGIKVPFTFTDAFNAMDAFPDESAGGSPEGDGVITISDWALILDRSLRSDASNFLRAWSTGGVHTNGSATLPNLPGNGLAPSAPGDVWTTHAKLSAESIGNVQPGQSVSVPVTVTVNAGTVVEGFQFKAIVTPSPGAPGLLTPVGFNSATASPSLVVPRGILNGYGDNELAAAWLNLALEGTTTIGYLNFQVSADALPGQSYSIRFTHAGILAADGVGQLESFSASVNVLSPPSDPAPLSDEWTKMFFGSLNSLLAEAQMDADGDGLTNLQEYLSGTNPADAASRLQFMSPAADGSSAVRLDFVSAPGKSYLLEGTDDIASGNWTVIETIEGDGSVKSAVQANSGNLRFFRIRLAQ